MGLNKEQLWKALKTPPSRDCGNCKYRGGDIDEGSVCHACLKIDCKVGFGDNWEWDEEHDDPYGDHN